MTIAALRGERVILDSDLVALYGVEANYYRQLATQVPTVGPDLNQPASTIPGAIQVHLSPVYIHAPVVGPVLQRVANF